MVTKQLPNYSSGVNVILRLDKQVCLIINLNYVDPGLMRCKREQLAGFCMEMKLVWKLLLLERNEPMQVWKSLLFLEKLLRV